MNNTFFSGDLTNGKLMAFGPIIYKSKISKEFYDYLNNRAKEIRHDDEYPALGFDYLAGVFNKGVEKKFRQIDFDVAAQNIGPLISEYVSTLRTFVHSVPENINLHLKEMWINYQKPGDYNPTHSHDGAFSFVIYLKCPKEIFETDHMSGRIHFFNGNPLTFVDNSKVYTPEEMDILIFPAKLEHAVWPFSVDSERISISGNFYAI